MTPRRARIYASVFVVLAASVAANVLLLQPRALPRSQPAADLGAAQSAQLMRPPQMATAPRAKQVGGLDGEASPATVRAIQRELKGAGYYDGPADGLANLSTHAAIMAYESDHDLELTGAPSDALLRTLILGTGRSPAAGASRSRVAKGTPAEQVTRLVQQQLVGRGHNIAAIDGRLGEDTRRAIAAFESEQRLQPSGRISALLLAKLQRTPPAGRVAAGR
jgi:peptidoglycan hydrolase-like protein with peptidoglycan-binding domain